jgi:nitrogen fixation protein NifX
MRIAVATQDRKTVDAHFAGARTFMFYDIGPEGHTFLEAVQFDDITDESGVHRDDGEDRLAAKIGALAGASLLFCRAIGGPAAARVIRARVHPVKLPADEPIAQVIERVRAMLRGNPPPWLRKAMRDGGAGAERFIDDED